MCVVGRVMGYGLRSLLGNGNATLDLRRAEACSFDPSLDVRRVPRKRVRESR
jgi:hypothetical protein